MLPQLRPICFSLPLLVAAAVYVSLEAPGTLAKAGATHVQAALVADPHAELLERARKAAQSLTEKIPNFICQQITTRYAKGSHYENLNTTPWSLKDRVAAAVVVENGRERYQDITVNGKPVSAPMEKIGGAWSTGEFATLLSEVLNPATQTHFVYRRDEKVQSRPSGVYEYDVDQAHSNWHYILKTTYRVAYGGKVWIDRESARVLRIEVQAAGPRAVTTVEYAFVPVGGEQFLLPSRANVETCLPTQTRDTSGGYGSVCSRNVIEFRNYKRFTSESTVIFDK